MKLFCFRSLLAFLLVFLPYTSESSDFPTLNLAIDNSDGGNLSARKITAVRGFFGEHDCPVEVKFSKAGKPAIDADLVFFPLASYDKNFLPFVRAESMGRKWIQPAIVVKDSASTSLSGLNDIHFSFVNERSRSGFLGQIEMLASAGVKPNLSKAIYAYNHIGAISLLMHKDTFAAGVDSFLAENWLQANNLKIIAKGDKSEVGGIYLNLSSRLNDPGQNRLKQRCQSALLKLNRDERAGRKIMEVFPDWLVRFVLDKNN
ncbi:MAG: PhnD/SsuA/transferrin family substrate-binding protein [Kangiellaceae bacterium]|nr:PhnD/SsuA/transferrin family substrate-binding protein [Kangiellaceae bacterium]